MICFKPFKDNPVSAERTLYPDIPSWGGFITPERLRQREMAAAAEGS